MLTPEEQVERLMSKCPALIDVAETRRAVAAALRAAVAQSEEEATRLRAEVAQLRALLLDTQCQQWEETGGYYDARRKQHVREKPT